MDTMKGEAVDPPEEVVCPSALLAEGLVVSADPSISSKISS